MPPRGLSLAVSGALIALGCALPAPAVVTAPPPALAPTPATPPAPVTTPAPSTADVTAMLPAAAPPPAPPRKTGPCPPSAVIAGECAEDAGAVEVEGWVVAVYCPPCRPHATCEPCAHEYVVLSDTLDPGPDPSLPVGSHLRVELPSRTAFKVGQRAKLRVIPGPIMFLGDPCCEPGRYEAELAP